MPSVLPRLGGTYTQSKKEKKERSPMRINWFQMKRPSYGINEEDRAELLERLNLFIDQYSATRTVSHHEGGWDYHEED
jgi:hypothetical protein